MYKTRGKKQNVITYLVHNYYMWSNDWSHKLKSMEIYIFSRLNGAKLFKSYIRYGNIKRNSKWTNGIGGLNNRKSSYRSFCYLIKKEKRGRKLLSFLEANYH